MTNPDQRAEPGTSRTTRPVLRRASRDPRRWSVPRWIAVLIAVNVLWRTVRYALGFPIWGDEAFIAVSLMDRGFRGMTAPLEHHQIAPILFMWAEWIATRLLGWSEWALRIVPFLAGVASVFLFARLARTALSRHAAMVAVGLFAASYYPVRHASELKPYSMDLLVALLVLLPAVRFARSMRGRDAAALTAFAAVGLWASYPVVFIAGGALLVLGAQALARRETRAIRSIALSGLVVSISFAAMYVTSGGGQSAAAGSGLIESSHWSFTFPPLTEPWRLPVWFLNVHTGRMFAYPNGGRHGGSTVTFLLFVIGCGVLLRRDRTLLWLCLAPFALMFIAAALRKYPYGGSARITQHVAPVICIVAGTGIVTAFRFVTTARHTVRGLRVVMIVMVALALVGAVIDATTPYKDRPDLEERTTIRALAAEAQRGDQWIMFGGFEDNPHVPNVTEWGGGTARLRFNVFRFASPHVDVAWGTPPEDVRRKADETIHLFVGYSNWAPMPEAMLGAYLETMARRLGTPTITTFDMHDRDERIVRYTYEP